MSIKNEVLEVVSKAEICLFPEEVHARLPHLKLGTVRASLFDLFEEGQLKAKTKDRPGRRICAVFYKFDSQIAGVEGLHPYEQRTVVRGKGKAKAQEAKSADVLLTLPIEGDPKVTSVTVTFECAQRLYATLAKVFAVAGGV